MPGCQSAAAVTMTGAARRRCELAQRLAPRPRASMSCSIACRSRLSRSSSAAMRRASIGSSVEQQARAERGVADAAAGIDARAEQKAEMPALRRLVEPRDIEQRGEARPLARAHAPQALAHEGAVEAGQRHHVGDRRRARRDRERRAGRARAARVQKPRARSSRLSATSARKTTPAAQRWPSPERSSWRFGLTTATAAGSASGAW